MIAFVRGKFAVKTPARLVVDVNGVGYELQISLNTYAAIANVENGQLYTYLHITENAQTLFGFADIAEKELFLQLISVSGVGAATARMMLSGMKPDEIIRAIVQGNTKQLEGIKGIGKKSAERLIVELRDKLGKQSMESPISGGIIMNTPDTDAVQALIALGIGRPQAEQAIKKTMSIIPADASLELIIKQALKNL
ncbi:MAG: Holliday junction branch migration protein RuvA [Sediminibacterium sp. Gen4]|mgnify:FL=1|jgi:holliday junction DNA helicase RuvA|uniref:Holliday junction branch migration protein RuvA n=1 Tax=unclassified Sediminibacterium TaxID=2635961 RepID=UPI0015BD6191|nr:MULTISPECIES: Holliday junction branch migration protein RuvA [unclassified Sediminibacterium]MBW0162601.1 Holliday junction branch migration protein RuvA [Sediminibacterium sp.]MBW0165262.1 Holliday junction branch migration protein RuvA [Sediminibacterium sp.]MDZ4072738.1 Holliday junction branch migration protein RuvA [Sediminibacterium sp.]NWK65052.1 Holliday junction branch migration protein RuvA [Sediminibacterium sp. Gen4]